ncbi:Rz1-like spanin outer membrane subunit [Pseudomonas moraviensis]|uniref:Rz1-like spanin outer membrane subunit n=1 Tax=Pseudomonas moraviensis TaxID=321662 RepID=UPI0035ABF0BB
MTVSACASNSPTPPSTASQLVVDPTLMATPNYTQTLLDFLSSKPNEQTPNHWAPSPESIAG